MANPYLEKCKSVAAEIDVDALASMPIGGFAGSGSGYSFRHLGQLPLAAGSTLDTYAGLKIPLTDKRDSEMRVCGEVTFIGLLVNSQPAITSHVPGFMNIVKIEDSPFSAILTEDVSANGQLYVQSKPASPHVRGMLERAFGALSDTRPIIRDEECDYTVAFDVAGTERLLDFTPLPVDSSIMRHAAYRTTLSEVMDELPNIMVTLPQNSPLSISLLGN